MRTAEVGNWTGLALVCPRTDLVRLGGRNEVHRTGVYILVGPSESSASKLAVYVGEGDEVWARLTSHDAKKDFWTFVVLFVSKDENMTKAHVRWLEARLVADLHAAKRADVENANAPLGGRLPEADTADMETYYENVRLLLPTLGVNVLQSDAATNEGTVPKNALVLELRWEDAHAECVVVDGQFIVQPGSTARAKEVESLGDSSRATRKALREQGVLIPVAGTTNLRFASAYTFDSPSAAAAVVSGTGLNGRVAWKLKGTGTSYKDWQEKQVSEAGATESGS
jgi:hypothetical protein